MSNFKVRYVLALLMFVGVSGLLYCLQLLIASQSLNSQRIVLNSNIMTARPPNDGDNHNHRQSLTSTHPDQVIQNREDLLWKPKISNDTMVIFIGLPKTGSRTLRSLLVDQLLHKGFQNVHIYLKSEEDNATSLFLNKVTQEKRNTLFDTDLKYVDFQWAAPPIYISISRDPIERFQSHFYYSLYGDKGSHGLAAVQQLNKINRENVAKTRGGNTTIPTLSECILQDVPYCKRDVMLYGTLQHLCGYDKRCSNPSEWTYNQAVKYVNGALAVGVIEEFEDYLRVLERLSPELFKGISSKDKIQQSRSAHSKYSSIKKAPLVPEAEKKLRKLMEMDYRIYNYIKDRFHKIKKELLLD